MPFYERKRKNWLNYDVTVHSYSVLGVSPESFAGKKKKEICRDLDFDNLDTLHILQKYGFFSFSYAIWKATYDHSWLEFGGSSFILYHKTSCLKCLPRKEEIPVWFLSWSDLSSVFQEVVIVHVETGDHRAKRRWGMRKYNYNLMVRALLWEQSPYMLVFPVWNQSLFSCVRVLSGCSGQWIYLPPISNLQPVSDGALVLCSSLEPLEDTSGYKIRVGGVGVCL